MPAEQANTIPPVLCFDYDSSLKGDSTALDEIINDMQYNAPVNYNAKISITTPDGVAIEFGEGCEHIIGQIMQIIIQDYKENQNQ